MPVGMVQPLPPNSLQPEPPYSIEATRHQACQTPFDSKHTVACTRMGSRRASGTIAFYELGPADDLTPFPIFLRAKVAWAF